MDTPVSTNTAIYQAADGVWCSAARPNERVQKGQLLGRREDFFGNLLHEYRAEADGVVYYPEKPSWPCPNRASKRGTGRF